MIGIIGFGFVGKAVASMESITPIEIYDKYITEHQHNLEKSLRQKFVFVCVPTDPDIDGSLNTSIVEEVAANWAECAGDESILVIKSTIPVGTVDMLQEKHGRDKIVFNPEFLTERTANIDFITADEVIIGTNNEEAGEELAVLYLRFLDSNPIIKLTTPREAELIKLARNSLYAIKIEYMNEIYDFCQAVGIDYSHFRSNFVWEGSNAWVCDQHTYVPGPDGKRGFGGKCLPKDLSGLRILLRKRNISSHVMDGALAANPSRRE